MGKIWKDMSGQEKFLWSNAMIDDMVKLPSKQKRKIPKARGRNDAYGASNQ